MSPAKGDMLPGRFPSGDGSRRTGSGSGSRPWVAPPLETFLIVVENLGDKWVEEDGEMKQDPQRVAREGANRDGLAAVAITILAVLLIVFVVSRII